MKPHIHKNDSQVIVYDADSIEQAGPQLFDEDYWQRKGCLVGLAEGRGRTLLLETPFGSAVLRRYLRGGWAAHLSPDRYLFTGHQRSRPMVEFHMLSKLRELGLMVPHPLAAQCKRDGIFYTGNLLTRRIADVVPLADLLASVETDFELWSATGACIRRFHENGVVHADLNARNILVRPSGQVYLIDFDRARIKSGAERAFESNLRRLRRSLDKLWPADSHERLESCWSFLLEAYRAVPRAAS
jgi:3-deoxy-D-manno-octulosonic acid kinase